MLSNFDYPTVKLNDTTTNAINALVVEANRIQENQARNKAILLIAAVQRYFFEIADLPRVNPEGKAVVRNENGDVIGLQG